MITYKRCTDLIIDAMYEAFSKGFSDDVIDISMTKEHWNSLYLDGDVPDDVLKQMIDMSYELVLGSLSKKKQKEIIESP